MTPLSLSGLTQEDAAGGAGGPVGRVPPGEGRTWTLQTATETAGVGREPWQAYMWAVWAEVT
jgi:hypothetical protein